MIKATFTDYISKYRGKIVRYVVATWPATRSHDAGSITVFREFENGKKQVRRLCYHPIAGYMIDNSDSRWWCNAIMDCKALSNGDNVYGHDLSDEEIATITEAHPNFRWTLQKAGSCNCAKAMKLLQQWLKDPHVELLVGAHYDRLALNRSFIRYGKDRRMAILKFVKDNAGSENWPITKIKFVMNGHTEKEYDEWKSFKDGYGKSFSYESYKYLISRKIKKCDLGLYRDYIEMAKECGHNVKDKYWYAPKNLKKAHDKVMEEVKLVREAKRLQESEKAKEETVRKEASFKKLAKKFEKFITKFRGLTAYVPQDTEIVSAHAKALSQCLVYSDYIGKMAKQKCLLVFIADSNGKPVATAEIMPGGKLGQFYGDEMGHDRTKMVPGKKAKKVLEMWMKKFADSKVKLHPRKEAA